MYAMLFGLIEIFAFSVTETPTAQVETVKAVSPADASVLITVDNGIDREGKRVYSNFSGTAISPTLIVTCWHGFREPGKATLNGKPVKLLRYDEAADVALAECEHGKPFVNVAKDKPKQNEDATAYGYEGGQKLGVFPTRVLRLNRFNNFPNITILGKPKQGRSGGGLFNQRGELIGVCSGFIKDENAGLYCGLEAVKSIVNGQSVVASPARESSKVEVRSAVRMDGVLLPGASSDCPDGRCPLLPKSKPAQPTLAPPEPRVIVQAKPLRSVMVQPVRRAFQWRPFKRLFGRR